MKVIKKVTKQTNNPFLNLYEIEYEKNNKVHKYFISSRKNNETELACKNTKIKADAVIIVPFFKNFDLLFIKQYRPAINDYIYEFPAGLIDSTDKTIEAAAIRELHEETGLDVKNFCMICNPRFTSVGLTDEAIAICRVMVEGKLSTKYQEENEDISFARVSLSKLRDFVEDNNVAMQASLISLSILMSVKG